ncbi:MAG: hypothetical protein ABFD79_10985 [Phycisphaerales bacterium]
MAESETNVQVIKEYKDRKVRMVVLGIIQLLLGCLALLMSAGVIANSLIAAHRGGGEVNLKQLIVGAAVYLLIAVCLFWLGIGLILTRRWARAISLILSWFWLLAGVFGFVFMLIMIPTMLKVMSQGNTPKALVAGIMIGMMGVLSIFYVILPALFVLLLSGNQVKMTCENRDAKVRWTDRCPLPVLALSLIVGMWAVSMLFMGAYNWTIPVFGYVVTGTVGACVILIEAVFIVYAAWALYRLKIAGWWISLIFSILIFASTTVSFLKIDFAEYFQKMGLSPQQYNEMQQMNFKNMLILYGVWCVGLIIYMAFIRKYFKQAKQESVLQVEEIK